MLVSLFRLLKIAIQSFYRNIWLSFVTLTIIILSLISVNVLIILNIFTNTAIDNVKEKIDINVYLKPNVSEDQAYAVRTKIESINKVKEVSHISADQALINFKKRHLSDDVLMESIDELSENPLGITFIIKANSVEDYPQILSEIEGQEFSEYSNWIADKDFNDYKIIIQKLNGISQKIRVVGYIASSILLFITLLIIFNSIKITIYTHHEEIEIMRLVGATSNFIRGPFIVESILYALLSWVFVAIIVYSSLKIIQPRIASFIGVGTNFNIVQYYRDNFIQIFGWQLVFIIVLSIVSSAIAIRKYLKA